MTHELNELTKCSGLRDVQPACQSPLNCCATFLFFFLQVDRIRLEIFATLKEMTDQCLGSLVCKKGNVSIFCLHVQ